jgi:phenylalanyl-tRNA synthetase beta chain
MTGPRNPAHWQNGNVDGNYDFFDIKGVIEELASALNLPPLYFEGANHPSFRPGRSARLSIGNQQVGWIGEVHPLVIEGFDILGESPVLAADLDFEQLLPLIPSVHSVDPLPVFPSVNEDIALIVDKSIPAGLITSAIENAGGFLLKSAKLFDFYQGQPIPPTKKSLAYHLTFQAPDKTLTDKVVRKNRERIVKVLEKEFGAKLRDA